MHMFMYMYVKSCCHIYTEINLLLIGKFHAMFMYMYVKSCCHIYTEINLLLIGKFHAMFMYMYVKSCCHIYTEINLLLIGKFHAMFAARKLSIPVAPVERVYVTDLHVPIQLMSLIAATMKQNSV